MHSMDRACEISIVVPAYNEEGSICQVVDEILGVLRRVASRYEVVVVDDGSTDATHALADQMSEKDEHVVALHHSENRGMGAALRTGYANARCEWVTFLPGDGQIASEELLKFIPLTDQADVITAYYVRRPHKHSWYRAIFTGGMSLLARIFLGQLPRRGGNLMFRRRLLQEIGLRSDTGMVNREILLEAMRRGYRIREVAIEGRPRLSGHTKTANPRMIARMFLELVRLRLRGSSRS